MGVTVSHFAGKIAIGSFDLSMQSGETLEHSDAYPCATKEMSRNLRARPVLSDGSPGTFVYVTSVTEHVIQLWVLVFNAPSPEGYYGQRSAVFFNYVGEGSGFNDPVFSELHRMVGDYLQEHPEMDHTSRLKSPRNRTADHV